VRFRLSGSHNRVIATGPFEPGERYRLTLEQGMPSQDDAVLQEAYVTELAVPNLEPSLDLVSEGMFLTRSGAHRLEIESVNVSQARLTVDRVYLNNLFVVFRYLGFSVGDSGYLQTWIDQRVGDRVVEKTLELGGERNQPRRTRLDLDDHLDLSQPGLYRVTLQLGRTPQGVQRWLLLTDLGVIAKRGDDGFDVWVSAFTDLSAVTGARVWLLSEQNQEIAAGTTDGNGRLSLPAPPPEQTEGPVPYFLTVERGEDFTFLLLDQTRVDTSGLDVGGASVAAQGYRAFLYGERDLYRPGETVEGVGVLRDETLDAPPPMPVTLRHRDPRGRLRTATDAGDATPPRPPREIARGVEPDLRCGGVGRDRPRFAALRGHRRPRHRAPRWQSGGRHLALAGGGVRPRSHQGGDPARGRSGPRPGG